MQNLKMTFGEERDTAFKLRARGQSRSAKYEQGKRQALPQGRGTRTRDNGHPRYEEVQEVWPSLRGVRHLAIISGAHMRAPNKPAGEYRLLRAESSSATL